MNAGDALKILKEGCQILDELDVTYWLSAGTALGAYRDGLSDEFLQKDTDLDVGIYDDKDFQKIKLAFENHGFDTYRHYQTNGRWSQLALRKQSIIFDLYFFYPINGELVNYNESGKMTKPLYLIEDMDELEVRGMPYPVPTPIEDYLVVRYGKDWKTPVGKVRWQDQCANLS